MDEEKEVIKEEPEVIETTNTTTKANGSNGKGFAITSMVLGLVGLFVAALPCGILAIVFAAISRKKIKSGMATAGLVLGIIDLVTWLILIIIGVSFLGYFGSL